MTRFALHRRPSLAGLLFVLALSSGSTLAQEDDAALDREREVHDESTDEARQHFQRGVALYTDGDLGGALVEFEAAYSLQPTYRLLYNLAQVSAELLDYVGAERYFVRYLDEGWGDIDTARHVEVEEELKRLRARIGTVTVETNEPGAAVFIGDISVGTTPLPALPVSAGQRRVRVQKPGFEPVTHMVNIIGGQAQSLRIDLTPTPTKPTLVTSVREPVFRETNYPVLVAGIATGTLLLATVGSALWARSGDRAYDEALQTRTSRTQLDKLAGRTEERALITDVLLGATVISAVVTTVLLATAGRDDADEPDSERPLEVGLGKIRLKF